MEHVFVVTAIIGVVELIKAINASDWQTVEIIVAAVIIGGLCGYLGIEDLTVLTGVQFGISATGTYKGLSLIGRGREDVSKPTITSIPGE